MQITALTSQQINMNKHIDTIQNQVDSIKRDFEDIHTRTNKTEKLVTSMENKTSGQLSEQTKRIQTLETVDMPETYSNAGTHTISERDSSRLQYKIRQEISEIEDIQSRKFNLILHNLPESDTEQDDIQGVHNLFGAEFHIRTKIVSLTRLGRPSANRIRLLKVQLPTIAEKKQILAKAKELRDSTHEVHSKVYIRPDMTKRQLEDSKNLHACLQQKRMSYPDKKWTIRKGEVVDLPTEDNSTQH